MSHATLEAAEGGDSLNGGSDSQGAGPKVGLYDEDEEQEIATGAVIETGSQWIPGFSVGDSRSGFPSPNVAGEVKLRKGTVLQLREALSLVRS